MRYNYFLLLYVLCFSMQAQISKLNEYSKGKFYSSDIIKDGDNNVKGYLLLYETDKIAKETYIVEYVLLDENLTRVTSGFITEQKYDGYSLVKNINVEVSLYKDKLLLELSDDFETVRAYKRYRMLDIKTFEMSEPFVMKDGKLIYNPKFDRTWRDDRDKESDEIRFLNGVGLVAYSPFITKNSKNREKYITHYDNNLQFVWKYVYDVADGVSKYIDQKFAVYTDSDEGLIVMGIMGTRAKGKFTNVLTVHFIDPKKGVLIKETIFPEGTKIAYEIDECIITKDKVIFTGIYKKGAQWMNVVGPMSEGVFIYAYDRVALEIINNKRRTWKELVGNEYVFNKRNMIEGKGSLYVHDVLPLSNGGLVMVCEAYEIAPIITSDLCFVELTPDFLMKQVFVAEKFSTKFPESMQITYDLTKYGLLDYVDYQNLDNDEFIFLFLDNEKNSTDRKHSTKYSIVSYSENKFVRQNIDLKATGITKRIVNAKKGYILIQEEFKDKNKPKEFRLEKVNY